MSILSYFPSGGGSNGQYVWLKQDKSQQKTASFSTQSSAITITPAGDWNTFTSTSTSLAGNFIYSNEIFQSNVETTISYVISENGSGGVLVGLIDASLYPLPSSYSSMTNDAHSYMTHTFEVYTSSIVAWTGTTSLGAKCSSAASGDLVQLVISSGSVKILYNGNTIYTFTGNAPDNFYIGLCTSAANIVGGLFRASDNNSIDMGYVVSDNIEAYPNGGIHTDGYYYEQVTHEEESVTLTSPILTYSGTMIKSVKEIDGEWYYLYTFEDSGTLSVVGDYTGDIWLCGAGNAGSEGSYGNYGGKGGGGGYTTNASNVQLITGSAIVIGAPAASNAAGGATSFAGYSASGAGNSGRTYNGNPGGSGGGGGIDYNGSYDYDRGAPGSGQGTSTRPFLSADMPPYGAGGGGAYCSSSYDGGNGGSDGSSGSGGEGLGGYLGGGNGSSDASKTAKAGSAYGAGGGGGAGANNSAYSAGKSGFAGAVMIRIKI